MNGDIAFLGLDHEGPGRYSFEVADHLTRLDGQLYGGAAIAVSMVAAEAVSECRPIWMTTQYVSSVARGERVRVHAEVLAGGRRTNQVRVTATVEAGDIIFASLGATAAERPNGISGVIETAPKVPDPVEGAPPTSPFRSMAERSGVEFELPEMPRSGFILEAELQTASNFEDDAGLCLWARRRDRAPITPAIAAYLADMVPMGLAQGLGVVAAGTSLDNTFRVGDFTDPEWVLLEIRPHLASGGYGHGSVHVWDQFGHLLATGSQTASMFEIDLTNPPWAATPGA